MRPIDSSYDRRIATSERAAEMAVRPDDLEAGDRMDYATLEALDDAGRGYLRRELARRGLRLDDDGGGYVVAERSDDD